jgi:hypothetical protein
MRAERPPNGGHAKNSFPAKDFGFPAPHLLRQVYFLFRLVSIEINIIMARFDAIFAIFMPHEHIMCLFEHPENLMRSFYVSFLPRL